MEWMILPFKRFAQFRGRSRRREFWMWVLFVWIVAFVVALFDTLLGYGGTSVSTLDGAGLNWSSYGWTSNGPLVPIWSLITLIPGLAVSVRRLHDLDKSGWWLLLLLVPMIGVIVLIVFWAIEGTRGQNRFGPDPLALDADPHESVR
jgi:uncharacterized membrane protein YhaH (DUF805 family)